MTFNLPDGTKITMNATGKLGVVTDIHIYNGAERISVTGVNTNNPTVGGVRYDAYIHDMMMKDGKSVWLGGDGDDWFRLGRGEIIGGGGWRPLRFAEGRFWIDNLRLLPISDTARRLLEALIRPPFKLFQLAPMLGGLGFAVIKYLINQLQSSGQTTPLNTKDYWTQLGVGMFTSDDQDELKRLAQSGDIDAIILYMMLKASTQYEHQIKDLMQKLDKASGQEQMKILQNLQYATERLQRLYSTCTNVMKSLHNMRMAAIKNISG
jgi:hypothetical protein